MIVGTIAAALLFVVESAAQAILVLQMSMMAFASMFVLAPESLARRGGGCAR